MKEIVREEAIDINVHAKNWQEAIRAAGKLLEKTGIANENYTESLIENVKENGSYIVIAPGLAIPHAHANNNVYKSGISYIKLAEPVIFPSKEENPVVILIALASVDNENHIDLIKRLATLFLDLKNLERIKGISDKRKILDIFNGT